MNIFVLDTDPERAATFHNDRHVCKSILEAVQLLSTAHVMLDGAAIAAKRVPDVMRPVYATHPCATWARSSHEAYDWLHTLLGGLLYEYTRRYRRSHAYGGVGPGMRLSLYGQLSVRPLGVPMGARLPFAQAMPIAYRRADPVRAYRLYYYHEKAHLAQWSPPANVPAWWEELEQVTNRHSIRMAEGTGT